MNLTYDPWIPVRRADGSRETIAPWQITEGIAINPIIAVASPRPDFDGALTQFLIGLLQTTCAPPDVFTWRKWRREAPTPDELRGRFAAVAHAFDLEGKMAFMQDYSPAELTNELEIAALLVDAPGENTLEQNKDHFIKRNGVARLCPACVATALFGLQTNAPSGGKGYRTGLRGGGPLTTLVLGKTLWETCWLNILDTAHYLGGEGGKDGEADRFPWLAPTRISEAKPPAGITTPVDVHPDQQFWAMPRRIRLLAEDLPAQALCDLCGTASTKVYRHFVTHNYGVNYQGFEHPLSPHYVKEARPNPIHPQPGGIGYRHWLGVIENSADGTRRPAKVVERFRAQSQEDGRLWAFGFDMDNMKARCWYDATMPLLTVPEGMDSIFKALVEHLIQGADWVADVLRGRVKDALLGGADARGDLSFVQAHFWAVTEVTFYEHAERLRAGLSVPQAEVPVIESWRTVLRTAALSLFDHYVQAGDFDAVDPRRLATARNDLAKALASKKLRELLGLPQPTRNAA
ncbi:type I-E CRISPR-associated protein Cse1/CasA [Acidithiobacillus sulfuriphilus]|uniref:Type I-E CRISPR-associated protein Cse1/CasA n=2 Tax=Acidithiobacillus sulfuriphilus TaxID=1867749 RepID=A0A3M8QWF1_9PROT|nr:type I-E CRISPR-associated protein Cse1/CasA [Acidithiobacillus sulfuriphilus]RNF59324.1 type I-E CRISPR-associated protein Cse1/CasA [Acidithiobacillus sulfuriphilus]